MKGVITLYVCIYEDASYVCIYEDASGWESHVRR